MDHLPILLRHVFQSICFCWKHTQTLVLATVLFLSASLSSADVIFDNFDTGGGFHPQFNLVGASAEEDFFNPGNYLATRSAAKFAVTGGDFTLTSVTLPVSYQGTNNTLRVRIAPDSGGAPGATLEVLSENETIWPAISNPFTATTTVTSSSNPVLADNTMYWIVLEPTSLTLESDYRWFYNTSDTTVPARQQQTQNALPMDPWTGFSGDLNLAFRVEGTILLGDFNQDGTIDAADYALWRSDPGSYGGAQGYADWVGHFGQTVGSGSGDGVNAAVPEPASVVLTIVGVAFGFYRRRRQLIIGLLLICWTAKSWAATVNVPGTSDPWLAGMPDGSMASGGDVAPDQSPVEVTGLSIIPGRLLVFSVTGGVNYTSSTPSDGPDGNTSFVVSHSGGDENGIAGLRTPVNALIGVFLDSVQPDGTPAPAGLVFDGGDLDFAQLTPELKQPFFVGDGQSTSGPQRFVVPTGATRLFLGGMDGSGWYNNSGSFDVEVTQAPALVGDYNNDGIVNAADYALWRSDPSSYGGAQGYTDWVNNFGQTFGSGSAASADTVIPEPATLVMLLTGVAVISLRRRVNSQP